MSELPDTYRTVAAAGPVETKVKGSKFVGHVIPVAEEAEREAALHAIRKAAFDATHHCWAARLGSPLAVTERSDDDGEPSGSAGRPILGALQRHGVHDALVVVVRWFGGTKLGTGGLVRAYGDTAELALRAAAQPTVWLLRRLTVDAPYDDLGRVEAELARHGAIVRGVDRDFGDAPRFSVVVPRRHARALRTALVEATAGRAQVAVEDLPPGTPG